MLRINFIQNVFIATVVLASSFTYADDDEITTAKEYATKAIILNVGDEPEGVTYNLINKTYAIVYESIDVNGVPFLYKTVYIPPTNVNANIYTKIHSNDNEIAYRYVIYSKELEDENIQPQDIIMAEFNLGNSNVVAGSVNSPSGWEGIYKKNQINTVSWLFTSDDYSLSIKPDKDRDGFDLKSEYLPGVITVKIRGDVPTLGLSGEIGNDEVGDKVNSLLNNDSITVYASGPAIVKATLFNATATLNSLKKHLKGLVSQQLLTEALFINAAEIIDATAQAATLNNREAAEDFLEDLSKLLHLEDDHDGHDDVSNESIGVSSEIVGAFNRSFKFTIDYIEERL